MRSTLLTDALVRVVGLMRGQQRGVPVSTPVARLVKGPLLTDLSDIRNNEKKSTFELSRQVFELSKQADEIKHKLLQAIVTQIQLECHESNNGIATEELVAKTILDAAEGKSLREFAEAFGGEEALVDNVLSVFFRGIKGHLKPGKLSYGFIEDREKGSYVDALDFFGDKSFREHLGREIYDYYLIPKQYH